MTLYDYPSNFSGGQNVTGIGSFLQYANYTTGNILGTILVGVIFLIAFLSLKAYSSNKAGVAAAFITTIFCFLFARIQIVHPLLPVAGIVAVIFFFFGTKHESPY